MINLPPIIMKKKKFIFSDLILFKNVHMLDFLDQHFLDTFPNMSRSMIQRYEESFFLVLGIAYHFQFYLRN